MADDDEYPEYPGSVPVDTSEEAADRIAEGVDSIRAKVWAFVDAMIDGATCDEVEVAMRMRHQTASARLRELELMGRVFKRGDRRPTRSGSSARVYVTTNPDLTTKDAKAVADQAKRLGHIYPHLLD